MYKVQWWAVVNAVEASQEALCSIILLETKFHENQFASSLVITYGQTKMAKLMGAFLYFSL
jgi:hypothetical protein